MSKPTKIQDVLDLIYEYFVPDPEALSFGDPTDAEVIGHLFDEANKALSELIIGALPKKLGYTESELKDLQFALSKGMKVTPKEIKGNTDFENGYDQAIKQMEANLKQIGIEI